MLMARSGAALQKMMDVFVRVVDAFGQEVSIPKTKVMVSERVTAKNPIRSTPTISVHGHPLGLVDSFVYLGCSVSWDGSLDGEIKRRVQRMVAAFSRWRSVLENFDIDVGARLLLFSRWWRLTGYTVARRGRSPVRSSTSLMPRISISFGVRLARGFMRRLKQSCLGSSVSWHPRPRSSPFGH